MLLWMAFVGGLPLMMGQHPRSESLFYYFRLEDQVPENHLLRLVDKYVDFSFVRRTRCPPPIQTPRMQQKAARQRVWGTTTTTWLITTAVSLWACKRRALA